MTGVPVAAPVDWTQWTVVLLKPDCLERDLVNPVLDRVAAAVTLVVAERITVQDWQIFTHYWDLFVHRHRLDVDVAGCLRHRYVGHQVVVALGHHAQGDAPARARALLGDFDPIVAKPGTIRADLGADSLAAARREHRLVDNLIHSSDDATAAWRDFHIWLGGHRAAELLRPPATAQDTPEVPHP
ncbi:nucleoside-diphosphate kinase [Amycolatopsis saalfeldensis]|uniref:Nucleoside diphosphate kinase n=1 Tax=Amycolatopsis saalfeldensis TaxID=394193 RepID=A0A1H8YQ16_9PSEU|nr:nucleoside-diphosphate kinase [Amycolatopsis saalfeldensis]SEP54091.1 nucleoside diphosphate kinase [Amycolatopsis saalfeldensis]